MHTGLGSLARRAAALGVLLALVGAGTAQAGSLGYAKRQYVDWQLAGGEPFVLADNVHHTLIYTGHEGDDPPLPARPRVPARLRAQLPQPGQPLALG